MSNITGANVKYIPKDAQVIMAILKELGINDFDPRVISQLLEFIYWHTTITLDDARVFANHAKKKIIDADDVRLAIQIHAEKMSSAGPPRDILLELARSKNSTSLAPIKPQYGIRLPPDRYCLTQPNYKLKTNLSNASAKKSTTNTTFISHTTSSISGHSDQISDLKFVSNSAPILKQMPMIPPRTVAASSNFISKCDILSDTSASNDVLISAESGDIIPSSSLKGMEIKTESEMDLIDHI